MDRQILVECGNTWFEFTMSHMEDFCVEILFSLCFGRMENVNADDIPLVFNSAQKKLGFDFARETLEQAFIRYFKENHCTLTLPLVGTQFYSWNAKPKVLDRLCDNLNVADLFCHAEQIRRAKHDFYASLKTVVQAEPYNPHDKNAILVSIESPEAKICGNLGLEKAGYIRALAAKVIRLAKPTKMGYKGNIASISPRDIVIQVTV